MPRKKTTESGTFRDSVVEEVKTQLRGGLRKVTKGEVILAPTVDIREDAEAFHLEFCVPGMKPEDLKVTVQENELIIEQERKDDPPEKKEGIILEEIEKGRYFRKFKMTDDIALDGIVASMSLGLLTLTLKKKEAEESE